MIMVGVQADPSTLVTSYLPHQPTPLQTKASWRDAVYEDGNIIIDARGNDGSTGKGILIGMLSALGSAGFVALIFATIYFFRYTSRGRIILDRIGRPGEYDDEQAFAREEAEALEVMDELQRAEYLRAKGNHAKSLGQRRAEPLTLIFQPCSFHPGQPTRDNANGHFPVAILSDTREGRIRVGIRTGAGDCKLLR